MTKTDSRGQLQKDLQKTLYKSIFRKMKGAQFVVTYWDDDTEVYGTTPVIESETTGSIINPVELPLFHLIFHQKIPYQHMLSNPKVVFAEAYMKGIIEVDGDLREILRFAISNESTFAAEETGGLMSRFAKRQRSASLQEQLEGMQYHYNLGNDFFRLWLDDTMSYSSAFFYTLDDSLKDAQVQKIDRILRKLNLQPGETVLDIGSGWGGLIIQAAREYGARAVGITVCEEQYKEIRRRVESEGLNGLVEIRLTDYRTLAQEELSFDKIVSVGMFEHVGRENIAEYFQSVNLMLKEGGVSLLDSITRASEGPTNPWLIKHIFPCGYIPSLREVIWELPEHGFHLLDVESLRRHFAMTADHWVRNFDLVLDPVRKQYGEEFVRMWRLYLAGSMVTFECGSLDNHQLLFTKGPNDTLPLTRDNLDGNA
jgi:cyclopropane-fatty-acyl-phospholipid synthase